MERAFQDQSWDSHKTVHDCRGRKRLKAPEQINDGADTTTAEAIEAMQVDDSSDSGAGATSRRITVVSIANTHSAPRAGGFADLWRRDGRAELLDVRRHRPEDVGA
ncbi:hypothetical protein EVAR_96383_1 [Eumeta japonica]|uniref:Uncharacterized protein n=1 Tax=Eumeta variegata TaxID=151549 RepID=A0A4C1WAC8_EUMVA|nr:hypothetical protein EVAR_96383_1 [Eumeta japonica]